MTRYGGAGGHRDEGLDDQRAVMRGVEDRAAQAAAAPTLASSLFRQYEGARGADPDRHRPAVRRVRDAADGSNNDRGTHSGSSLSVVLAKRPAGDRATGVPRTWQLGGKQFAVYSMGFSRHGRRVVRRGRTTVGMMGRRRPSWGTERPPVRST